MIPQERKERGLSGGSKGAKKEIISLYPKPKSYTLCYPKSLGPWDEFQSEIRGLLWGLSIILRGLSISVFGCGIRACVQAE
jgi:hypothetical protein